MTTDGMRVTDFGRRPILYFHTSSADKWLQARILAAEAGLVLTQFLAQSEPYDEDYSLSSNEMLAAALSQAVGRVGRASLVFVEDTTMRLDALSSEGKPVPGLRTKEWFAEASFYDVDRALRAADNRRTAVRSDIALHIPGLRRVVYFSGETTGMVVEALPPRRTHEVYRWLSTRTFNGWFVPDGATKTLGEMQFEESRIYDFRDKALSSLFDRIVEYAAALNLPPSAYRRRKPLVESAHADPTALPLDFPVPKSTSAGGPAQFLVIGRTCAGKSTFAARALSTPGFRHIEASDALRRIRHDIVGLPDPSADMSGYAFSLLQHLGMDKVAQQIVHEEGEDLKNQPVVISGLRTIEEIATFRRLLPVARIIYVDAPLNMRFERYTLRGRGRDSLSRDRFESLDRDQDRFGLLPVARDVADVVINNRESLTEYLDEVDRQLRGRSTNAIAPARPSVVNGDARDAQVGGRRTRLSRALTRLRDEGPLTLKQLEEREGLGEHNASRILGFAPSTTLRTTGDDGREYWEITEAGRDYLSILAAAEPDADDLTGVVDDK